MIEAIQDHDYVLLKLNQAMAFKLYNKPLAHCNKHEKNEVSIQTTANIRKNKKKQEEEEN